MFTVTVPAEYSTCTWMYISFKTNLSYFWIPEKPWPKSKLLCVRAQLINDVSLQDRHTDGNDVTIWFISIRACQNDKIEQFHELWRIETPCIKMICVGLIFKYGVSCRFHETPTVNVFVRNLIDDVITIKNTALPPHIPRID